MAKKSSLKELPFKVSARAARLIGRENVANAEGAIIELVKNAYDADANTCILYFDENSVLHILDNGHGMTDSIIEKYWMTIGTNNKEVDITTKSGRVKTGAKGIGRFALDRLGEQCDLHTFPLKSDNGYIWRVNWQDFESNNTATIGDIKATLDSEDQSEFKSSANEILGKNFFKKTIPKTVKFENGTLITISNLRDSWTKSSLDKLFKNLSSLIPPKEEKDFAIYVFSHFFPNELGLVDANICNDFDYKVAAKCDKNQNVTIQITRNEQDLDKLDKDLFKRIKMKKAPYDKATFYNKSYTIKLKLNELIPGFNESDRNDTLKKIGAFTFTFYFMKKQTTEDDRKRFYYRQFDTNLRNLWLDEHVGIRIFRDGFRVRPYGEPRGTASDWLPLAPRYQASPAGVAKEGGGYKVREYNVSGSVEISRLGNIQFQDKMNREGIQENYAFDVFKKLLIGIISLFENDRSYIARELDALFKDKNIDAQVSEKAADIKKKARQKQNKKNTEEDIEIKILSDHSDLLEKKIEGLVSDQKILRVLASNGAMVASFVHELHGIKTHLIKRTDTMNSLISPFIKEEDLINTASHRNPFIFIDDMKQYDKKLYHWMEFALGTIRKDKRKQKNIYLDKYFSGLEKAWSNHVADRQATFTIKIADTSLMLKAFEIDFDTIFNNLIINSLDAFQRKNAPDTRNINISCREQNENIKIIYSDSGPGLSKDIKNPDDIFNIHFSTKRDPSSGEEIGTGIGMWLIQKTVEEYRGKVTLDEKTKSGFSLSILLPVN